MYCKDMEKKLKVVWLCHFSNNEIQNSLGVDGVPEIAPWIPMAIKTIEDCPYFEVYVVFEHPKIHGIHKFELRGVHYIGFSFIHNKIHRLFHNKYFCLNDYRKASQLVGSIVDEIKPDVIHCFGAELGELSSSFIPLIDKYPSILTVQGFIYKTNLPKRGIVNHRIAVEKKILQSIKVAFTESKKQGEDIKGFNPGIELYWHFWGSYEIKPLDPKPQKKYDIVFFARLARDKGLYDLLDAVSIIKQSKSDISLCVIGGGNVEEFDNYAKSIGVNDNVVFTGFLPTRDDVHRKAQEGRISVLPTYNDINPGTIIESMFLEIPVVTSDVDTNPEVNKKGEVLRLVPVGNVDALATSIIDLLNNPLEQEELALKAKKRAYEMYAPTNEHLQSCLLEGYSRSICLFNNHHNSDK